MERTRSFGGRVAGIVILLAICCCDALRPTFVRAAEPPTATAVVTIRVLDDIARAPIAQSDVRLLTDGFQYSGISDSTGTVRFRAVAFGTYGVIAHNPAFAFTKSYAITVSATSANATVTVFGTRTRAKTIGIVQARGTARPDSANAQAPQTASGLIGGSVGSSLGSVTSVGSRPFGDAIEVHNENASQTTATVNGAPIFPTGSTVPTSLFNADVFSAADVRGGTIGAPSGSVDFQTYDPTIDWSGLAQSRVASYGAASYALQERGTTGRFGLSFTHGARTEEAPFNDTTFADTSGRTYLHDTSQRSDADTFSLRYGFDADHIVHVDAGRLAATSALTCTAQAGPLPCGYGPGIRSRQSTSYLQLRDEVQLAHGSVRLNLFGSKTDDTSDFARQLVENEIVGSYGHSATNRTGAIAKVTYALSNRRTATLDLSTTSDSSASRGVGSAGAPLATSGQTRRALSLGLPAFRSRKFQSGLALGVNDAYGTSALTYRTDASYTLSAQDTVRASFADGALASRLNDFSGVDPAQLLIVDCASRRALGNGPTGGTNPGTTQQVSLAFARQAASYRLSLNAYHHLARQSPISAVLPSSALRPSPIDAAYLATANATASAECGASVTFGPSDLHFIETAPVSRLTNDGLDFGATFDVNPRADVSAGYSLSFERANGASPLFAVGSTIAPGGLVAGATVARFNASTRYALSRATTAIANIDLTGPNNPYARTSFTTLDLGVRTRSDASDLVVAMQNVTGAHGSGFRTFDPFPTLTRPFSPRTLSVRFRIALGRQNIDHADYLTKPLDLNNSSLFLEEKEFEPLPAQGWLAQNTASTFCGPETAPKSKKYFVAIEAFARAAAVAAAGGAQPTGPLTLDGMTLTQLQVRSGYAIRISFERGTKSFSSFLRCGSFHTGSYAQSKTLGLFIPAWQRSESDSIFAMYFAPQVGLYFPPNPVDEARDAFEPPKDLPKKTPLTPFALVAACPASLAPAMREAVNALERYATAYYHGDKPTVPAGFTISRHTARAENWLEIRAENIAMGEALSQCLNVPATDARAITERGLGSALPPSLNYAPSVGFYTRQFGP